MQLIARYTLMLPLVLVLCAFQSPDARQVYPQTGSFERLQEEFDEIVPTDARLEMLATGFVWSEGPIWRKSGNYLLFSDVINNTIHKWSEARGIEVFLRPAGYIWPDPMGIELGSNGLAIDENDNLLISDHGNRRIVRLNESNYTKETLVSEYQGNRLNSPNDLTFHTNGDIYFTDPPFGLDGLHNSPDQELDFAGVYRYEPDTGELTLLTDELEYPNGLAFSPDERTLYVAHTRQPFLIMAYDVLDDGTIDNGRVFFDANPLAASGRPGGVDGMELDEEGNIFATGPGGVLVISPDGTHLGSILTGQPTGNVAWGDDGSTLYITSNQDLLRIRLNTSGLRF